MGDLVAPLFAVIGTLAAIDARGGHRGGPARRRLDAREVSRRWSHANRSTRSSRSESRLRTGAVVPRLAPFGTFRAADGWFAICAPTDAFADGTLRAIGRPDLVDDARFATRDARVHNADELHALIREWAASRPIAEVLRAFESNSVPVAPVRDTAAAVRDPLVLSRHEVVPIIHPQYGHVDGLYGSGLPVHFSRSRTDLSRPAPALGEQTDAVLHELLGYDARDIERLRTEGVL